MDIKFVVVPQPKPMHGISPSFQDMSNPMDRRSPPNKPRYKLTRGLSGFRQQKRCHDIMSRQEVSIVHHLTGIANCPLGKVLTYKNLIYLINLQFLRFTGPGIIFKMS